MVSEHLNPELRCFVNILISNHLYADVNQQYLVLSQTRFGNKNQGSLYLRVTFA